MFDIPNACIMLYTQGASMVILHSNKILEQLTEIEDLIQKLEGFMDEKGINCDREKILVKLLKSREASNTSQHKNEN
jgi:hypothetical protein